MDGGAHEGRATAGSTGGSWDDPTQFGRRGWADRSFPTPSFAPDIGRAPGVPFHLAMAVPTVAFLHASSTPGYDLLLFLAATVGIGFGAILWMVRLAAYAFTSQRPRVQRRPAWFLVAPLGGLLLIGLVAIDAPLRARWALARDDFAQVVERAPDMATGPADPLVPHAVHDPVHFDVPGRIGTYAVDGASRVPAGVLFHTGGGGIGFSDAGFAHLPGGPPGGLGPHGPSAAFGNAWFETITFRPLGGDWYAWDAVQ